MSTRKTTLFYRAADLPSSSRSCVGMVIASRLDLTPASSAQTLAVPPMNSAPVTGALDAPRLPQHRQGAAADGRQHPDRDEGARRRTCRTSSAAAAAAARRLLPPLLRRPGGGQGEPGPGPGRRRQRRQPAARSASRRRSPPAPASSSARTASSSPTTTSSKTRPRSRSRSSARTRQHVHGQADRPRRADRQRADSARRRSRITAAGSEVRRLVADGSRRLGHGDRQPVQPRPARSRVGVISATQRPFQVTDGRIERDAADRRGDQPGQLRRAAAEPARRGHRHEHGHHQQRRSPRATSASASPCRSTPSAICCRSCARAR